MNRPFPPAISDQVWLRGIVLVVANDRGFMACIDDTDVILGSKEKCT